MKKQLGFLTGSGIFSMILTLMVISGFVLANGFQMFSPGNLSGKTGAQLGGVSSHAEIGGRCSACHTAPWESTSMSERCVRCHIDIGIQLQDSGTLHGVIFKSNQGLACRTCHPEHHGLQSPTTSLLKVNFRHDSFGFSLTSHNFSITKSSIQCADCHGEKLSKADSIPCGTCHLLLNSQFTETHLAAFGADCLACHDGVETYGKSFDHQNVVFKLTGGHQGQSCEKCHEGQHSLTEMKATAQNCVNCHQEDDQHNGRFGSDCSLCHNPGSWQTEIFDHNLANYHLEGKHQSLACKKCHVNRVFAGTATNCYACHSGNDKHLGNLGTDCAQCHNPIGWLPVNFDHNLAVFTLTGLHLGVPCTNCHVNNVYRGTSTLCYSCHVSNDKHQGLFGSDCGSCHTTAGWLPATFDHSLAKFKLTGQHLITPCQSCHNNGVYKGTPTTCYACHGKNDPHFGSFGTSCGSCHSTSAWLPASFDHSKSAFPLTGAHKSASCSACHVNNIYKGTPTACSACHQQPSNHAGINNPSCSICHTTSNWTFNHPPVNEIDPLHHKGATCADCHPNGYSSYTCSKCHD